MASELRLQDDLDELYLLIAAHCQAYSRFLTVCSVTDETLAEKQGRKVTQADQAEYEASSAAETEALLAVLRYPTKSRAGARTKIGWIRWQQSAALQFEPDEIEALLSSLEGKPAEAAALSPAPHPRAAP